MPSWPTNTKYISQSTPRVDAAAKLTGRARYSSDIQADGWLYGMILRSKWPAAKISEINLDKALQVPGIKAAITVRDGERMVHFYGEELAAVAGTTRQACLDAFGDDVALQFRDHRDHREHRFTHSSAEVEVVFE